MQKPNTLKPWYQQTSFIALLFLSSLAIASLVQILVTSSSSLNTKQQPSNPETTTQMLVVGETELLVEIRDDAAERALGLSGRKSMPENQGMLFIFEQLHRPIFWMKDMNFALDVIWIANGVVVDTDERVPPPTDDAPKIETMTPAENADMVLEVNAGWIQENEVSVGDTVELK